MPFCDWSYDAPLPFQADGAWWFEVRGLDVVRHGPFPSRDDGERAHHALFRRFDRAARARGGWAWRSTAERWVVTVPPGVPARGRPMRSAACTRHDG